MSVCKICLCSDPEKYLSQTSENVEQSGEYVLLFCLGIQVFQEPEGSVKLCEKCFTKLTEFYQFKYQALRNEALLSAVGLEKYIEQERKSELPSQDSDDNTFDEPLIAYPEVQDPIPGQLLEEIDPKLASSTVVVLEDKPTLQKQDVKVNLLDEKPNKGKKLNESSYVEFVCAAPACDKRYTSRSGLVSHLKSYKSHMCKCAHCGKTFLSKELLVKHIFWYHYDKVSQKLTKERTFFCKMCPMKFGQNDHLTQHVKEAHDNKKCCQLCNKKFSAGHLDRHIKEFHMDKNLLPYKCDHCDKGFSRPGSLKNHVGIHTGLKPFPCDICGAKFRLKYSVTLHKAEVHEKSKNHMCHICSKHYFTNYKLSVHMRNQHPTQQPVVKKRKQWVKVPCPDCGKQVIRKGMRKHRVLHQGQKHPCIICGLTFATRDYVLRHMKTHYIIKEGNMSADSETQSSSNAAGSVGTREKST